MTLLYPPPAGNLSIVKKLIDSYKLWQDYAKHFPKTERFNLGHKISQTFIESLELVFTSSYLPIEQKIIHLSKLCAKIDILKFFIQIAWECKFLTDEKYIKISNSINEVGRMAGGWKKGLLQKTSRIKREEK